MKIETYFALEGGKTKAANGQHMLNMCSHITLLLAKPDVFCTKKFSQNLP